MPTLFAFVVAAALVAGGVGCDRGNQVSTGAHASEETSTESKATSHPAGRAATAFLEAVQYRDVEGAWKRHVESTRAGVYCSSDAFTKILERTRERKTERDCTDARKVGPDRRAALEEDAEFLLQVLRFVCEQPEGDCIDYARRVFETQMPRTEFWSRMKQFEIERVRAEEAGAEVYVDYWSGERTSADVHRRTLHMKRFDGDWYVTDVFGSEPPTP